MRMESVNPGPKLIDAYGGGGFRIGGERYEGAVFVTGERITAWSGVLADLPAVLGDEACDLLIVGTGATLQPLSPDDRALLEKPGFGVEPMTTASACRTYNVLLSEGRRVGAALLAV